MAKKVASGATHVVFDIPVGPTMKIAHFHDAETIAQKFTFLAEKFHIKVTVDVNDTRQNAGRGVGPVLEARDVFQVLEQDKNRPLALEAKALRLAGKLLTICYQDSKGQKDLNGEDRARDILVSGKALEKMREIIRAQGGNPHIESRHLIPARNAYEVKAQMKGHVVSMNNHHVSIVGKILGCPTDKNAGLYFNRKLEGTIDKGDILCTLYSSDKWRLKEAIETLKTMPIYTIE